MAVSVLSDDAAGGAEAAVVVLDGVVVPDGDDAGTEAFVDGVSGVGAGLEVDGSGAAGAFRTETSGAGWCFAT